MVANFTELHDQVHQVLHLLFVLLELEQVACANLILDPLIEYSLTIGHLAGKFNFRLRAYFLLNISLKTAQHKGLEHGMQSLELVLVELALVHARRLDVLREPLLELLVIVEQLWHDKVKQGPELGHRVLDWCTGQQKSISRIEL